ncbi:MAG: capsid staple protein [Terracidiphilus sp.]
MSLLIDMESSPEEKREMVSPSVSEAPKYPWGLCITLNDDSLEKLGVKTLPAVGTVVTIVAKATVSTTCKNATVGEESESSMDLQITDMQIDGLDKDLFGRASDLLYGKAKD